MNKLIDEKIARSSKIYVFGTGRMGQQVMAACKQITASDQIAGFVSLTESKSYINETPVIKPTDIVDVPAALILVSTGRVHHAEILESLQEIHCNVHIEIITGEKLEALKKVALEIMLSSIGIDVNLLKSFTNDTFSSVSMFDEENYNYSIRRKLYEMAAMESASFVVDNMEKARSFSNLWSFRKWVLDRAPESGLCLEFGVADGGTLEFFAGLRPNSTFYGFDSFVGLPEFWKEGFERGRFLQKRMPSLPKNVKLIKGWFSDTIEAFLAANTDQHGAAFVHIDCDLYSSTLEVLNGIAPELRVGTVILFDEFFNYPGWTGHEFKALCEIAESQHIKFKYIGYVENGNQVAIEIEEIG